MKQDEDRAADTATCQLSFERFYAEQYDRSYRSLCLAIRDIDLAREATDEAMARAFDRWPKVGRYDAPEQWVFRVGINWAISRIRKDRRIVGSLLVEPSAEDNLPDPDLAEALSALPLKLRAVVVARFYLDWSTEQTSQALRIPKGTVKSRLSRALQRMNETLESR